MKKEVVIAIFIGCLLGLVITFGIRTANQALVTANKPVESTPITTSDSSENQPTTDAITPAPANKSLLTISSPDNNFLTNTDKIKIVGKTDPNMNVLIIYEEDETVLNANSSGDFSQEISLIGGANQVDVSVFDNDGNQTSKTLNIVYSTAEI